MNLIEIEETTNRNKKVPSTIRIRKIECIVELSKQVVWLQNSTNNIFVAMTMMRVTIDKT